MCIIFPTIMTPQPSIVQPVASQTQPFQLFSCYHVSNKVSPKYLFSPFFAQDMVLNTSPQKTAVKVNIKTSIQLFQDHIPTFVCRDQKSQNQPQLDKTTLGIKPSR